MKAAVLYEKRDIRIEEVDKPTYGDNEVLLRIKAIGICGSDVHYYEHFGMGPSYKLTKPQILGHESLNTTAIYTKNSIDQLADITEQLNY